MILSVMRFKVRSELPGAVGRLDLTVELPGGVHLIIEMKYCPKEDRLTKPKRNRALARAVLSTIDMDVVHERLAPSARQNLSLKLIAAVLDDPSARGKSQEEKNRLLGRAALDNLPETKTNPALAGMAKELLSPEEIEAALREAKSAMPAISEEMIGKVLSKATDQALRDIIARGYHDIIGDDAAEIIDLGLAIYGPGHRLKADFGPTWASSDPTPPIIDEEAS